MNEETKQFFGFIFTSFVMILMLIYTLSLNY